MLFKAICWKLTLSQSAQEDLGITFYFAAILLQMADKFYYKGTRKEVVKFNQSVSYEVD